MSATFFSLPFSCNRAYDCKVYSVPFLLCQELIAQRIVEMHRIDMNVFMVFACYGQNSRCKRVSSTVTATDLSHFRNEEVSQLLYLVFKLPVYSCMVVVIAGQTGIAGWK